MPFGRRYGGGYGAFGYDAFDFVRQMRREEEYYRRQAERERLAELQRVAAGSRRRTVELECQGKFTPAGVWDADCERWPEYSYSWDLGGGLVGTIQRSALWSWNGYVTLPEGVARRTEACDFWNSFSPRAPVHKEFTYGGRTDIAGRPQTPGKYGWDHTWGGDLCPFGRPLDGGAIGPNWGSHATYNTAEMVIEEVWCVGSYFASLILDGTLTLSAGFQLTPEMREGLFRVQHQEMRIADRKRKEREAREAAAAAAAEAERQRLWDLAHPLEAALRDAKARAAAAEKDAIAVMARARCAAQYASDAAQALEVKKSRLPRVQEVLAFIAELEERQTAGEELTAAEKRQLNRKSQLQREVANRAGESDRYKDEEKELERLRAEAVTAEAAAAPSRAAVEAVQAEVAAAETAITKRDADAKAAELAAEEARIAAAEAAALAAELAAEREVKTKRLGHVIRLLGEIDAIRVRRDAGDNTLDALQLKKVGRLRELEKERVALEAALA